MKLLFLFSLCVLTVTNAQNTLQLETGQKSPNATLDSLSWIEGHWRGTAFGGITEEIWSPPLGGSMMFVFKLVNDNQVSFYEIGHIRQLENTLILQLKHFHGDLKGWETKDETVDFRLIKIEDGKAFFEGFTFEKVAKDELNVYVLIEEKEVKFNYKRFKN